MVLFITPRWCPDRLINKSAIGCCHKTGSRANTTLHNTPSRCQSRTAILTQSNTMRSYDVAKDTDAQSTIKIERSLNLSTTEVCCSV